MKKMERRNCMRINRNIYYYCLHVILVTSNPQQVIWYHQHQTMLNIVHCLVCEYLREKNHILWSFKITFCFKYIII